MEDYKLGAIESRFADIIWDNEPMTTKELVDACAEELNWKRPTTYSILKKLSEKYPDKIYETESGNCNRSGSVSYIVPKVCVSVREPYSEERRNAAREIAKKGNYKPPTRRKNSNI